jgi:tetratricopeptide (TPR) repeat protein/predicted Ser/Thr protein kinase
VDTARCLETSELLALALGECDDAARGVALAHAATCESCRQAIAGVAKAVPPDLDEALDSGDERDAIAAGETHPPSRLGRYRVVRVIGRGAMGTVYEAFDPILRRRVAVKRIHAGARELGQRLRHEAQVLARLADPHVVAVLEAGPDWLAMELVEGETLARWQVGRPPSVVIAAYLQAARGLAAAHALGVVHRDFKPSNVLVRDGDHGVDVRVADFGLATAIDDGNLGILHSGSCGLVGTPAYMAPEQFLGRVADARSDQFAFCVALHEALAGVRPFAGDDITALCAAVLAGRTQPRPRNSVPRAIWRVIERGLSGDPQARWPSMNALASALVRAESRRRPWLLVAGAITAVAIVAGAQTRTACDDARDDWDPARTHEMRAAIVGAGLEYGRATADGVVRQLDAWSDRWSRARADLCGAAAPDPAMIACLDDQLVARDELVRLLGTGGREAVLGASRAAQRLPTPAACNATRPSEAARELSRELIAERATLSLRSADDDLPRIERSLARAETIGDPATIADARGVLGLALALRGHWERAMPILEAAYFESYALGDDAGASDAANDLALGASWQGKHDEALRWARLAHARAIDPGQRAQVAAVQGQVLAALGRIDEAELVLATALGDDVPSYARVTALTMLATIYSSTGRPELAEAPLREAIAAIEAEAGDTHPELGRPLNVLGILQMQRGQALAAKATLERARELLVAQLGEHHPMMAFVLGNLALAQGELGDPAGAYESLEQVLAIFERDPAGDPARLAQALHNLAKQAVVLARFADVRRLAERSLAIDRELADDVQIIVSLGYLARGLRGVGDPEGAMRAWGELIALRHATVPEGHDELGWAELEAAITAIEVGWQARAEPHIARALVHYATSTQTSEIERARAERIAARVRPTQARTHLQRARTLLDAADPADARLPNALQELRSAELDASVTAD